MTPSYVYIGTISIFFLLLNLKRNSSLVSRWKKTICMSAPLAPASLSVFRGQTCQKAHKAGGVLEECASPSPPLFFQPQTTFSGNPGRSNILSLGPRRLFPQGEVIDYSATCDACRCACDVARDVSFASVKTKTKTKKAPPKLFPSSCTGERF